MQSNLEKLNVTILKMYEAKVRFVSNHIDWMSITQMIKWNWQQTNRFIFILFWAISNGSEATNFSSLLVAQFRPKTSTTFTHGLDVDACQQETGASYFECRPPLTMRFYHPLLQLSCIICTTTRSLLPIGRYCRKLIGQLLYFSWSLYYFRSWPLVPYQVLS